METRRLFVAVFVYPFSSSFLRVSFLRLNSRYLSLLIWWSWKEITSQLTNQCQPNEKRNEKLFLSTAPVASIVVVIVTFIAVLIAFSVEISTVRRNGNKKTVKGTNNESVSHSVGCPLSRISINVFERAERDGEKDFSLPHFSPVS